MTRRAGLDKVAVIEEALRLIDEEGLEQLSLGRLAERLGVRVPSLYNHIDGLPGLKRDLAVYCLRELCGRLTRSVMGKARADAIFALTDAYRAYARQMPGHYSFTLHAPDANDEEWQRAGGENIEILHAILAPYELSEEAEIHAIRSLRSIVHGFIDLEIAGAFALPINLDESFHWLVCSYIEGLERIAGTL